MAKVSYEILTTVKKTYHRKSFRAYVFTAQVIFTEMTAHNFAQLGIPAFGNKALLPVHVHISRSTELTNTALKAAITKRMNAIKKSYEAKLQPAKEPVILTATGNYKDVLSTKPELSK